MSDDRPRAGEGTGDDEGHLRGQFRLVAGVVILGCIVFLVVVDALGRLFVRPDFHVGDVFIGTLIGSLLLLAGVEGISRIGGRSDR